MCKVCPPKLCSHLCTQQEGTNQAGRIYTITVTATDEASNAAESQYTVQVPHDMRK